MTAGYRCVFEIWVALDMDKCEFGVVMPPGERVAFNKALTRDFDTIFAALSKVDLRNAQASVESDKLAIFSWVGHMFEKISMRRWQLQ